MQKDPTAQNPQANDPQAVPQTQTPVTSGSTTTNISHTRSLADLLYAENLITQEQLEKIKLESARSKQPIEKVIKQMGVVSDDKLVKAKSMLYGVPYMELTSVVIPKEAYGRIPQEVAQSHKAIPFAVTPEGVKVAMVDPLDIQAVRYLEQRLKVRVLTYSTTEAQFEEVYNKLYGEISGAEVTEAVTEALEEVKDVLQIEETGKDAAQEDLSKVGVAKVVNMILESAVKDKASDTHIEPMKDRIRVRFRVDGVMLEKMDLPLTMGPALVSRIKILAQLKIDVKRKPQDGRFFIQVGKEEVDLRVSTMPTVYGEKVVMRLLKRGGGLLDLEKTGMRGSAFAAYIEAITTTNGIILITGPTGSGKTVTLASSINRINTIQVNVVTLEDPVEIKIPGANQVQINPDAGLTFANGLRSILRQDPDIVMVGEIRDEETARLATKASLTGHLVLSTLHTNNAAGALPRLLDMNIEGYLIASTVRVAVGQRLVRTLCTKCRERVVANPDLVTKIKMVLSGIRDFNVEEYVRRTGSGAAGKAVGGQASGQLTLYKPKGCKECDKGYSGRTGIFEVLKVSDKIGQMIMKHNSATEIEEVAKQEGMMTMIQDGYMKALEGITTIEEVLRVTKV